MKESLLQWIWQYQYFHAHGLQTSQGEPLQIVSPGQRNDHQGPDFLDARVRIGDTLWVGAVEIHVSASDWEKHAHRQDKNYRNVILHVVWTDDTMVPALSEQREIPALVLEPRVSKWLLSQYEVWMKSRECVPCRQQLQLVNKVVWEGWLNGLIEQRLQRKVGMITAGLSGNQHHWEECCWWLIARTFGGPVNGAAFEMIARSLPLATWARLAGHQTEALLLGQAGLLEGEFADEYPISLQREYRHLKTKYGLAPPPVTVHFLRMRPGNFPTIRLAQLSAFLQPGSFWFNQSKEAPSWELLKLRMAITAGSYWDEHYIPDRPSARRVKQLGDGLKDSLLINVFVPLLYAYGTLRNEPAMRAKALAWLNALPPEKNTIVRMWKDLGIECRHAGDSQALLELKWHYCDQKNCLQCAIGKDILLPTPAGRSYPS
jgi:hypothetical protein